MMPPAREPRDQRTFDLLLQVDHGVVPLVLELAMKASQLEPGRACEDAATPTPQRDGYHTAHAPMHADQIGEWLFDDPVDFRVGAMPVHIVHDRQCMHDVAERRRTNDKDSTHALIDERPYREAGRGAVASRGDCT